MCTENQKMKVKSIKQRSLMLIKSVKGIYETDLHDKAFDGYFPMSDKNYRYSFLQWIYNHKQISEDDQLKYLLYEDMYYRLKKKIDIFGPNYFNDFLLLSFHETIMKMQKNKCKFMLGTKICNIFEAIVSIGVAIALLSGFVKSFFDKPVKTGEWLKFISSKTIQLLVEYGILLIIIFLIIFVFYKLMALNMRHLKPKETWIRHSMQCYKMVSEISMYLDGNGLYKKSEKQSYEILRQRIMEIWQDNLKSFQNNNRLSES